MPELACKVVAVNGRTAARPCEGWWGCNDADVDAWTDSSRVVAAYALDVAKWVADKGTPPAKAAAIELIQKRVALLNDVASVEGMLIEFSQAANQRALAKVIVAQEALCNALGKVSELMDGISGAPAVPSLWKDYEEKRADFFNQGGAAILGGASALLFVGIGVFLWVLSKQSKPGRSRR